MFESYVNTQLERCIYYGAFMTVRPMRQCLHNKIAILLDDRVWRVAGLLNV